MPRGSKKSANQHNSRHENGVVAPGKRIRKQRSTGHLNGTIDGASQPKLSPSRSHSNSQPDALADKNVNGYSTSVKNGFHTIIPLVELNREISKDATEEAESPPNGGLHFNDTIDYPHRKIDVNAAGSTMVQHRSIFRLAYTILRSCPIADTIAILIFLLSLPQTLLTLTNSLFAVLTFMPPAGSLSSFPTTLSDVFTGSGGTPSLATIVLTDFIGLILWLILWAPLQSLALELAQAVVATTLGGGNTTKSGSSDSTLLCMLIVAFSHIAHHRWLPNRIFDYDWPSRLSPLPYFTGSRSLLGEHTDVARSPAGWFRVLVALHILIQGLVHVARRWYTKREYSQGKPSNKKIDTEAVVGSQSPLENGAPLEVNLPGPVASPIQLRTKSSIPNLKETREKTAIGKKKKKQGTYVRNQQPLWAAFAATKVTILREFEQSHAFSEAVGSNAVDTTNLGSAPFAQEEGRVWIIQVQATKFCFGASFSVAPVGKYAGATSELAVSSEVDRTKPIYVRVNETNWASTQIERLSLGDSVDESADRLWSGEVYGLTPACRYNCSFVRSEDDVVIFSTRITTPSSPPIKKKSSIVIPLPHPSKRPSSPTTPTTTLKKSIDAIEASLNESLQRQKRSKKDNKAAVAAMKKEIEILHSKISKLNGEDKAHQNRHLQWNQHTRQADEQTTALCNEIESLGSMPETDLNHWKEEKASCDEARKRQLGAREDLARYKEAVKQKKTNMEAEALQAHQKLERLQSRHAKLCDQHKRLQSAVHSSPEKRERREIHRPPKSPEVEEKSNEQITIYTQAIEETRFSTAKIWQQIQLHESLYQQNQQMVISLSDRVTPEGDLTGTSNHAPTSHMSGFRFPTFAPSDSSTPLLHSNISPLRLETRHRSVSLLSGNSVYTDFSDQDPAPPIPLSSTLARRTMRGRQPSSSSGSGSGSVSSQREQISPVGGVSLSRPIESPVEKRKSPVWNP